MYLRPQTVHKHSLTEITELAHLWRYVNGGDMMNIRLE